MQGKRYARIHRYYSTLIPASHLILHENWQASHWLTSKVVSFVRSPEVNLAFERLKEVLVQAPALKFLNFSKPFTVTTNASKYAIGVALSQSFDREEHPVAFTNRQLNGTEQKCSAMEQERPAVAWAVRHFWCCICVRYFQVMTEWLSLKWLMSACYLSLCLAR